MNIRKALLVTLSTGLIATTLVNTNYVSADDTDEPGLSAKSEVEIKFKIDDGPRDAVKPVDPKKPWKDFPGTATDVGSIPDGKVGPLAIDYVTHIKFGEQTIEKSGESYKAETKEPFVQVTDDRFTGEGWHVAAQLDEFILKNEEDNEISLVKDSLPGAVITLADGDAKSTIEGTNLKRPRVSDEINLKAGYDDQLVASANNKEENQNMSEAEGLGTWVIRWLADESDDKNNNVTLTVPKGLETPGSHTTTINWTLSDGPSVNHETLPQQKTNN